MILASVAIYYSSASFRRENFYNRLINRAWSTARSLLDTYNSDANSVRRMERDDPSSLQNEKIIIINYLNDVIYSSDEKGEIEIRNDVLERARLSERVRYKQEPYEVLGALYVTQTVRYVIIAAASDTEGFAHLNKLRLVMIVVLLISLVLIFIAGWIYSGRALKPISDVIDNVGNISITSLNLRVPEGNGNDEIGRLARTFNDMLERLETSFTMQKDFIANASHELSTPLTAINGQLEVLMMKDRSAAEYKAELESILDDIKSLIDLSNRLLLIARTSAEGPVNFSRSIRIDEILWQAQEDMKKFKSTYRINISIDNSLTDSDQIIVTGDEYLIKVAFTNIIDNACKYSTDNTVNIKIGYNEKWIEVIFEDNGIGIPEEDISKVFEPFYRGSNTHSTQGSGIGLPLVNQIIKNHQGKIKITSQIGKGTIVTLLFPSTLRL